MIEFLSIGAKMISVRQMKAARALLAWSQSDLAQNSGVSEPTIARLESADSQELGGRADTAEKLQRALERAGVEFIPENGGGAGVRMKKMRRKS
jgi:transcriptional regulator with XRE-family HTH domain